MHFQKFQALGNDFLIVREQELRDHTRDFGAFAKQLCDRHFGAGADGLEVILKKTTVPDSDFEIRLFNADGGETPISGNGTRCVGAFLFMIEGWVRPTVRIATAAGVRTLRLMSRDRSRFTFEAEMGAPRLASADIPVMLPAPAARVVGESLTVGDRQIRFTSVSMGNPHCSLLLPDLGAADFDALDWRALGAALETHPAFPDRTNVEFIRVLGRDEIEVRFWERGCGETLASGTGSCAAAIACMLNDLTDRKVKVKTVAGDLLVEWRNADNAVIQTGDARAVFRGELS
ncbi:MAG: diaminopimelate epimerase [Blastocatellia bacterium]